jgi:hypothetical protein
LRVDDALQSTELRLAFRYKSGNLLMFWDGGKGWSQKSDGSVSSLRSISVLNRQDWLPVLRDSEEEKTFLNKQGPLPLPRWLQAVHNSPVKRSIRITQKEQYNVCLEDGSVYIQSTRFTHFYRVRDSLLDSFHCYTDWLPMEEDHPLASVEFTGSIVSFSDPRIHKGESESKESDHQGDKNLSDSYVSIISNCEHAAEILKERVDSAKELPYSFSETSNKDYVPPELLTALGPISASLASAIESMAKIEERESAVELSRSLLQLVKNATWLLRENRSQYRK